MPSCQPGFYNKVTFHQPMLPALLSDLLSHKYSFKVNDTKMENGH